VAAAVDPVEDVAEVVAAGWVPVQEHGHRPGARPSAHEQSADCGLHDPAAALPVPYGCGYSSVHDHDRTDTEGLCISGPASGG